MLRHSAGRDWSERHIIELIKRHGGGGGGEEIPDEIEDEDQAAYLAVRLGLGFTFAAWGTRTSSAGINNWLRFSARMVSPRIPEHPHDQESYLHWRYGSTTIPGGVTLPLATWQYELHVQFNSLLFQRASVGDSIFGASQPQRIAFGGYRYLNEGFKVYELDSGFGARNIGFGSNKYGRVRPLFYPLGTSGYTGQFFTFRLDYFGGAGDVGGLFDESGMINLGPGSIEDRAIALFSLDNTPAAQAQNGVGDSSMQEILELGGPARFVWYNDGFNY